MMISNRGKWVCEIQSGEQKWIVKSIFSYGKDMTAAATRPAKLTARGRETRHRIVAAAAELMFKDGVTGTTLEDVKEAAGVSSSQI
jgi:hypothetical protein